MSDKKELMAMFAIKNKMMPHLIEGIFNEIWDMRQPEIDQLNKENERLKEYLEMFWIQSNSLSMYFRSIWTTDGMKEKIGLMYDLQCEVENVLK